MKLKIIAAIFFIIALLTGSSLLEPLRQSTESVNEKLLLKKGVKINFNTYYSYPYKIELSLKNADEIKSSELQYKLTIDGREKLIKEEVVSGDTLSTIGSFEAKKGDKCTFELVAVSEEIHGKNGFLQIDVNGGGPSIAMQWAKQLRPKLLMVFWTSVSILFITIIFIFRLKRKVSMSN